MRFGLRIFRAGFGDIVSIDNGKIMSIGKNVKVSIDVAHKLSIDT